MGKGRWGIVCNNVLGQMWIRDTVVHGQWLNPLLWDDDTLVTIKTALVKGTFIVKWKKFLLYCNCISISLFTFLHSWLQTLPGIYHCQILVRSGHSAFIGFILNGEDQTWGSEVDIFVSWCDLNYLNLKLRS